MTFGRWAEIHHAFRELFNFEVKAIHFGFGYSDIEKEIKHYQEEHQPVTSLLSI